MCVSFFWLTSSLSFFSLFPFLTLFSLSLSISTPRAPSLSTFSFDVLFSFRFLLFFFRSRRESGSAREWDRRHTLWLLTCKLTGSVFSFSLNAVVCSLFLFVFSLSRAHFLSFSKANGKVFELKKALRIAKAKCKKNQSGLQKHQGSPNPILVATLPLRFSL